MSPNDILAMTLGGFFVTMILLILTESDWFSFHTKIKLPRCFPFHDWGKWEDVDEGYVMKTVYNLTGFKQEFWKGSFVKQQKVCAVCNKKRLRVIIAEM